jgi:hypothetical protein
MPSPFSDKNLQMLRVADFSPGIIRFSRGGYSSSYGTSAPLGSAAQAVRCIVRPNVGLVPYPSYRVAQNYSLPSAGVAQCLSVGNMRCLSAIVGAFGGDYIIQNYVLNQGGTTTTLFNITRGTVPIPSASLGIPSLPTAAPTLVYTESSATSGQAPWSQMDEGLFQDPSTSNYAHVVITTSACSFQWVTISSWLSPTTPPAYAVGALPSPAAYTPKIFYHANRAGLFHSTLDVNDALGFGGRSSDALYTSDLLSLANWTLGGFYFTEMGAGVACWGSISTGELFMLYAGGGAVLLYGDMFAPSSAYKLPGVVGPGFCTGPAAQSPAGLIYATESDGAYLWNGGNTSSKISNQIPDDMLFRAPLPSAFNTMQFRNNSMQVPWGAQVMFPNNWVYDTITSSWWMSEDPNIVSFQVYAASLNTPRVFYATPGYSLVGAGVAPSIPTYQFDNQLPATTYSWLSNPIPVTQDALVSIELLEIIASNNSITPSQITVTPTVPTGQNPLPNSNQNQPLVFIIPPNTVGYRASQRLGYTDYNVQIQVYADGLGTAAPILHEFSVGYTSTRVAGVQ